MVLRGCRKGFLVVACVAIALLALATPLGAFVHGPSSKHTKGTAAMGYAKGHQAQQKGMDLMETGAKFGIGQNVWLAACRSLLVGAALGLIVSTAGMSAPSYAQEKEKSKSDTVATSKQRWNVSYNPQPVKKEQKFLSSKEQAQSGNGYLACLLENDG